MGSSGGSSGSGGGRARRPVDTVGGHTADDERGPAPRRSGTRHRRVGATVLAVIVGAAITSFPAMATASTSPPDVPLAAAPSPSPSHAGGNEADAMSVVAAYERAFAEDDCDLFVTATTTAYRERIGLTDCEVFAQSAAGRAQVLESLEVTPISASGTGRGTIAARVHTEAQSYIDENGQPVATPVSLEADHRYHLVRADGAWKVDAVHDVTGGRTEGQLTADEKQSVARTMSDWRAAYSSGDCAALEASTTAGYRELMAWTDCPAFEQYISDQNAYCPMDVHPEDIRFRTNVDPHLGEIIVDVVEVCTLDVDEFGAPLDPPYEAGAPYRYHLVDQDGTWRIAEGENGAAAEDEPSNANERAAIETMRAYNDAWLEVDCDAYLATTTASFRTALNSSGCAAFGPASRSYSESVANFAMTATDIERPSANTFEIKSHETYDSLTDADGQVMDAPIPIDEYWVYTLVLVDGAWVITDVVMLL